MLYLTAYKSSHFRKSKPAGRIKYESFDEPDKAFHIWYLENSKAIENAKSAHMEPLILTRQEVPTLDKALELISRTSPVIFKYLNDDFNDEEANQIAQFIRQTESLEQFEFLYCHTGGGTPYGTAYRFGGFSANQPKNELTNVGFELITQAIAFNPSIQKCATSIRDYNISSEASRKRELLLERNRKIHTESKIKKALTCRDWYHELLNSYPEEMVLNSAISKMITIPTLQELALEAALMFEEVLSSGLSSFSSDLLPALEPEKPCELALTEQSPALLYNAALQLEPSSSSNMQLDNSEEAQSSIRLT